MLTNRNDVRPIALALVIASLGFADPPVGPPSPEVERESFRLADPALTIELVAAEPVVESPVAMAWDETGALFVAEMSDYPDATTSGKIKRLEDRDGDGLYEHATVFAAGLPFPNSVLPWKGGVLVTAAPNLWYFRDQDGDGIAERRDVLVTGFAEGNQQLRANGLNWGLDNWVYGANGRSGGALRRPDRPRGEAVSIARNDFRFKPGGGPIEAIAGFSQFGLPHDDLGERFPSWNTAPIRHVVLEESTLARNPRLAAAETVAAILDPNDGGRVFPIAPAPRTFNGESFGYFNASCGPTIYRGDALPDAYRGNAFVCEPLTSLVHRRVLEADGQTYLARRVEVGKEFLASSHSWFRPVNLATGPDGAIYVADFCRALVEHPAFVAERLRGGVDFREGHEHGRIWRIRPRASKPRSPEAKLRAASSDALIASLSHPNGWRRDTAQRLLVERRDMKTAAALIHAASTARGALGRIHALWSLEGIDALNNECLLIALRDPDARVRAQALILTRERGKPGGPLEAVVLGLADDPDPRVRFRCAIALGGVETAEALGALSRIAHRDADDPWVRLAVLSGLNNQEGRFLSMWIADDPDRLDRPTPGQARLLEQLAETLGVSRSESDVETALDAITASVDDRGLSGRLALLSGLANGLARSGAPLAELRKAPPPEWRDSLLALDAVLRQARALAESGTQSVDSRGRAIEALTKAGAEDIDDLIVALLDVNQPVEVQSAAARGLAERGDPALAAKALKGWETRATATRRGLLAALVRSGPLADVLIRAVADETVPLSELDPATREALRRQPDPAVRQRAEAMLKAAPGSDRAEVVRHFEPALELDGNPERGAAIFEKNCMVCHQRQGRGARVGPDLSGVAGRPRATLLTDILDPSREVAPDAINYMVVTNNGRVLDGLLVAETPTSVRLRRAEGAEDTVLRSEIAELRGSGRSLMPEGLEQNLSAQDLADLIELLRRPGP